MENNIGYIPWSIFTLLFAYAAYSGFTQIFKIRKVINDQIIYKLKRPFFAHPIFLFLYLIIFIIRSIQAIQYGILSLPVIILQFSIGVWLFYIFLVGKYNGIYEKGIIIKVIYIKWSDIQNLNDNGNGNYTIVTSRNNIGIKLNDEERKSIQDHIPNSA